MYNFCFIFVSYFQEFNLQERFCLPPQCGPNINAIVEVNVPINFLPALQQFHLSSQILHILLLFLPHSCLLLSFNYVLFFYPSMNGYRRASARYIFEENQSLVKTLEHGLNMYELRATISILMEIEIFLDKWCVQLGLSHCKGMFDLWN